MRPLGKMHFVCLLKWLLQLFIIKAIANENINADSERVLSVAPFLIPFRRFAFPRTNGARLQLFFSSIHRFWLREEKAKKASRRTEMICDIFSIFLRFMTFVPSHSPNNKSRINAKWERHKRNSSTSYLSCSFVEDEKALFMFRFYFFIIVPHLLLSSQFNCWAFPAEKLFAVLVKL